MSDYEPMTPLLDPAVDQVVREIADALDHVSRLAGLAWRRLNNAERAGAAFADTVQRFLADPAAVGTDALYQAYGRYTAAHAGNFTTP